MFAYILIYLFSLIFAFCYSKSKDKFFSVLFISLTFLVLFLPAAFRYNIGTDYENYTRIIENNFLHHRYNEFEIGWIPVLWFIDYFDLSVHFFFVFTDFTILLCLFYVLEKRSFWCCIPIYVCFAYIQSYSLVRQALAATIFLIAIKKWTQKKYFSCILFSLLSFIFHKSVIILVLLLFLANFKWSFFNRFNNFVIFVFVYVLIDRLQFANILMEKVVGNTFYAAYLTSDYAKVSESSSGLGLLLREFLLLIGIIASDKIVNKNVLQIADYHIRLYRLSVLLGFAGISFFIMSSQIHIFNRLPSLIVPFLVLMVQCMNNSKFKYRKIALIIFEFGWFVSFIFYLKNSPSSAAGGLGLTPYQSIFSR